MLDLFEMVTGVRMHDRYPQFGGVAEDLPKGFYAEAASASATTMPQRIDEYLDLLAGNPVWKRPLPAASARSTPTRRSRWASRAPTCAPAASPFDLRRVEPYLVYDKIDFDVITGERGDAYDRLMCRTKEMYESVKIIEQCLDKMPSGPVMADDRKYVLPPRHELHTSMESLIHHFKLVTEGFRVTAEPDLLPGRVAARRVRLLPGLRRRPQAVADPLPRAQLRQPAVDRDDGRSTATSPT